MNNIGLTDWLIAVGIVIPCMILFLLIPSFIEIVKRKSDYFKIIKVLYKFKIHKAFTQDSTLRLVGTSNSTYIQNEKFYYYVNIVNSDRIFMIGKSNIQSTRVEIISFLDKWESQQIKVGYPNCLIMITLLSILDRKIKNIKDFSNYEDINNFLNREVTQLGRNNKLNKILN